MKFALLFTLLVCAAIALPKSAAADILSDKTDNYVKEVLKALHIPGLALAVVRDGKVIKAQGYGLANVEFDAPVKPETVFLLASMTKQFTATCIMMLVEEGKVALDDGISKYLPDTPDSWKGITVRMLLNHTAGLKDRFEGKTGPEWLLTFTTDAMYKSARGCALDFKPGAHFQYSDQGYFLLGMIIEKVSGKTYREYLTERIFKPLEMAVSSTSLQTEIVKNLASGYTLTAGKLQHNHRRTDYGLVSHFGIISTVLDLAKWDAALYGERFLKKSSIEQMWTPGTVEEGMPSKIGSWHYGFGWFLDTFFGHRIVQHAGASGTCIWRLPDDKLTVIVLTNLEQLAGGDAPSIAKQIAQIYLPSVTWAVQKPSTDPDAKGTDTLREETLRIALGKPDTALYTAEFGPLAKTATQSSIGFYKSIGKLKGFEHLETIGDNKSRTRRYRADYEKATLYYTFRLAGAGKISFMGGEFEETL